MDMTPAPNRSGFTTRHGTYIKKDSAWFRRKVTGLKAELGQAGGGPARATEVGTRRR